MFFEAFSKRRANAQWVRSELKSPKSFDDTVNGASGPESTFVKTAFTTVGRIVVRPPARRASRTFHPKDVEEVRGGVRRRKADVDVGDARREARAKEHATTTTTTGPSARILIFSGSMRVLDS
jgi:hypothetical protein